MLRQKLPGLEVQILDAPALQMGWRTLEAEVRRRSPAYVGIGEEAVSCVEGLRLARLAKSFGATVIAGGCFFGNLAPQVLATGLIDVVVHGEGELTLVELIQALREGDLRDLRDVAGISFRDREETVTTAPRALIPNLDDLPFPAYDLLPVHAYGARSRNHPRLAAIELSRGCFGACDFCVLWRQMGRHVGDRVAPQLRAKSPERLLEEVRILVKQYDRGYLGWVDPCFNAHPDAPGALAELMLGEGLRLGQSAWVRTDALVRDSRSGALATVVASGLNEVYLGIERPTTESLTALGKTSGTEHAREAVKILRDQFPEVLRVGSFIYGLPGDSTATVRSIHRFTFELGLDVFFIIPLTPLPGTALWDPALWDDTGERFREFNFLPTGRPHGHLAALERAFLLSVLTTWPPARIRSWMESLFLAPPRRRRIHHRLEFRAAVFHLATAFNLLLGGDKGCGLVFPRWYES
jgi:radical SAM superfamily enzyme YgiQ (UPF0313 family)